MRKKQRVVSITLSSNSGDGVDNILVSAVPVENIRMSGWVIRGIMCEVPNNGDDDVDLGVYCMSPTQ